MLPTLAQLLRLTMEALMGQTVKAVAKRGPPSHLAQQVERIGRLSKTKQRFVMEMLDTVLARASQ